MNNKSVYSQVENILIILLVSLIFSIQSMAENPNGLKIVKVKKSLSENASIENIKKVGEDEVYNYFEVSEREIELVNQARDLYKNSSRKLPSRHMRNKMQDQVPRD